MIKQVKTDALQLLPTEKNFYGAAEDAVRFLTTDALTDPALWKKFVQTFRDQQDGDNLGWRGEYWGKSMRGAAMVYAYSQDENLYRILTDTVRDLLTVAEADGRVSTYRREQEIRAWDLWCRKYVLLGLEYYYDICKDEALKAEIIPFLCGCANAIIARVGKGEGQIPIEKTSESWGSLNSSSILEPIVRLYSLTGEKTYFDFATYIVEQGGSSMANIFELAYENKLYPYQYGVSKAYEMISCFEGLIEYYYVTGIEKYKTAVINFGKALIDSDVSVIGSLGATHELLDHAKNRQTAPTDCVRQETCVTVTWMKFCARLLRLTGESIFADCIEQSFYNAYCGALNTDYRTYERYLYQKFIERLKFESYVDSFLPFDSYSPLTPGTRGRQIGGCQPFPDTTYYGCCACIGAAGVGSYLDTAVLCDEEGILVNFFESGETVCDYHGNKIVISMQTEYPRLGAVKLTVKKSGAETLALKVRIPAWSQEKLLVNGAPCKPSNGYAVLAIEHQETVINVELDLSLRVIKPIVWDTDVVYTDRSVTTATGYGAGPMEIKHLPEDDLYVCLMRGPVTLAADSRMGKAADSKFTFQCENGAPVYTLSEKNEVVEGKKCLVHCVMKDENGEDFSLIDYGSAGRDWRSKITAWMPI